MGTYISRCRDFLLNFRFFENRKKTPSPYGDVLFLMIKMYAPIKKKKKIENFFWPSKTFFYNFKMILKTKFFFFEVFFPIFLYQKCPSPYGAAVFSKIRKYQEKKLSFFFKWLDGCVIVIFFFFCFMGKKLLTKKKKKKKKKKFFFFSPPGSQPWKFRIFFRKLAKLGFSD